MNIGLYQSASSLTALERWQDIVSQNITSAQTTGFRKRTVQFSTENAGEWRAEHSSNSKRAGIFQPAVFPKITTGINFEAGETLNTRRELDVAIQGPGFFELKQPDGLMTYTRSGEFMMRSDRTLVGPGNAEVMTEDGSTVVLLPGSGGLMINGDGSIFQNGTLLGRLAIKEAKNHEDLVALSGGLFSSPDPENMETVEEPEVLQGYLEQSNVSSLKEMVDLVLISRAYEANQKVISSVDQLMGKVLESLG